MDPAIPSTTTTQAARIVGNSVARIIPKYRSFAVEAREIKAGIRRAEAATRTASRNREQYPEEYESRSEASDEIHHRQSEQILYELNQLADRKFPEDAGRCRRAGYALSHGSFVAANGPDDLKKRAKNVEDERNARLAAHAGRVIKREGYKREEREVRREKREEKEAEEKEREREREREKESGWEEYMEWKKSMKSTVAASPLNDNDSGVQDMSMEQDGQPHSPHFPEARYETGAPLRDRDSGYYFSRGPHDQSNSRRQTGLKYKYEEDSNGATYFYGTFSFDYQQAVPQYGSGSGVGYDPNSQAVREP